MKHWEYGRTDNHATGIYLKAEERIISIAVHRGMVAMQEECDGWFGIETTKEEAIEMLQETIDWIKSQEG